MQSIGNVVTINIAILIDSAVTVILCPLLILAIIARFDASLDCRRYNRTFCTHQSFVLDMYVKPVYQSFHAATPVKRAIAASTGFIIGVSIPKSILGSLAPSIAAASSKAGGMSFRAVLTSSM